MSNDDIIEKYNQMINKYGMTYIVAPSEADDLCAYLCISGKTLHFIGRATDCILQESALFFYIALEVSLRIKKIVYNILDFHQKNR